MIGIICGFILSMSTAVFASNSIQAILFPSKVLFHANSTVKEIDGTGENGVLNYNNKAYIPLRTFAEAMGATVTYEAPSRATGNLSKIDIFSSPGTNGNDMTLEDPDGYVNIGDLYMTKNANGDNIISSGTVKVNKDLTGKQIDIEVLDKVGKSRGKTDYIYIVNEDIDPPKIGDVRPFQTDFTFSGDAGSYRINVRNILKLEHFEEVSAICSDPIEISIGPPSQYYGEPFGELPIGRITPFGFGFLNRSKDNLTVRSFDAELEVYKADAQNRQGELVYSYTLPTITGSLASQSGYGVTIPWNQRGLDGKFISPGNYLVRLNRPDTVSYYLEESSDIKTADVVHGMGCNRRDFLVQFK